MLLKSQRVFVVLETYNVIWIYLLNNSCAFLQWTYFISLSVRMWDIRPFAPLERCLKVFTGAQHNFEKVTSRNYMCTCVVSIEKKLQLKRFRSKSCCTWIIRQCKAGHTVRYACLILWLNMIYTDILHNVVLKNWSKWQLLLNVKPSNEEFHFSIIVICLLKLNKSKFGSSIVATL